MAPTTRSATQLAARLRESRSSNDPDHTRVKSPSPRKASTRKRTTTRISKPKGTTQAATTRSGKKKGPGKGKSATRNRSTTTGTHHDSDTRIRVDNDEIVDTPPTLQLGQLSLHFPQSRHFYAGELEDLPDYPNCLLHAKYPVKNQSPATINITASSVSSEHCIVYTGTMEPGNQQVIVKYAPMKELLKERVAYQDMEALQGTVIPKFYGLFFGREEDHDIIHTCMVLEHCGTTVSKSFSSMPRTEVGKVLNVLAKIHRAGLHHLDFAERNVVVAPDGGYRIIDFEHMEDHTCHVPPDFDFSTGAELPQDSDEYLDNVTCCYRISRVAVKTGYYDPHRGQVYFNGQYHSNMPSRAVVKDLMYYLQSVPYLLYDLHGSWKITFFRQVAQLEKDGATLGQLRKDAPLLYEQIQDDWQAANPNTSPYDGFPGFQIRDDPQLYLRTHNYQRPPPDYQHPREVSQGILVADSNVPQSRRDSPSPQT